MFFLLLQWFSLITRLRLVTSSSRTSWQLLQRNLSFGICYVACMDMVRTTVCTILENNVAEVLFRMAHGQALVTAAQPGSRYWFDTFSWSASCKASNDAGRAATPCGPSASWRGHREAAPFYCILLYSNYIIFYSILVLSALEHELFRVGTAMGR